MALDKPCSNECGRWARLKSDLCETCGSNKSTWKGKKPAQRMRYRQRIALATRRQESYAEEFGDPKKIEEIELETPPKPRERKGNGRRRAEVIDLNSRRHSRRKRA